MRGYSYGRRYQDDDTAEIYDQRGIDDAKATYAQRNSFEVRWSPWEFGVYFALGALSVGSDEQEVQYESRTRLIGDNAYVTGMTVKVRDRPQSGAAGGIGFNHVFGSGLSLGVGFVTALAESDPPKVTVTTTDPSVNAADLAKFKQEVEDANRAPHGMLHLAIGWNF